jgi:hypothetical protein
MTSGKTWPNKVDKLVTFSDVYFSLEPTSSVLM